MQPQQENGESIAHELKNDTKSLGISAVNRLHSEVDSRKNDGVSQIQDASSALQKTADGLGENSPIWLKSAFEQGAEQINKFASTLEQKDSRQLVDDVNNFARQSPGIFLAVCAATGFAISRVFKVGGSTSPKHDVNEFEQSLSTAQSPDYSPSGIQGSSL